MRIHPLVIFGNFALGLTLAAQAPTVPDKLTPPAGQSLIFQAHGKGVQIYACTRNAGAFAWKLRGPDAQLLKADGSEFGRHYAGPTWEASDHSRVTAKVAATVPAPSTDAIPWLLLSSSNHTGEGVMRHVLSIQRINTKGGIAPASACAASNAGAESRIPYEARYLFYGEQ